VDGLETPGTALNELTIALTTHTRIQALFSRLVTVNSSTDGTGSATTPGTLRYALANAADGDIIAIDNSLTGHTIALASGLPEITKDIVIEGNGITLSGASITPDYYSNILRLGSTAEVTIRRVHFKDGKTTDYGGAIYKSGNALVVLESCIFSGNQASSGGAIYNTGQLIVRACTFYGNTAISLAGAIYNGTVTLTGNLFYGNGSTAPYGNVVYVSSGTVTSGGYNVSDYASGTNSPTGSGWTFVTGDTQVTTPTVDTTSFKPLSASLSTLQIVPTSLADYPATDFYGNARSAYAGGGFTAAGAVAEPAP
jgi:predicted outer membrane repeat protein